MTLSLLRLPNLARENVVDIMEIREQFNLAYLSQKAKTLVKTATRRHRPYALKVAIDNYKIEFQLRNSDIRFDRTLVFPVNYENKLSFETCLIATTFPCSGIFIHFNANQKLIYDFIQLVKHIGIRLQGVNAHVIDGNDEVYKFLLRECRECSNFELNCSISQQFEIDLSGIGPFNVETLTLHNANWITADHIKNWFMDCQEIKLYHCTIPSEAVKEIVQKWIDGSKNEFLRFPCVTRNADFGNILTGISKTPTRTVTAREQRAIFPEGKAFRIRQASGVEAVVSLFENRFMLVTIEGKRTNEMIGEYEEDVDSDDSNISF